MEENKKILNETLIRGRDWANKLQNLVRRRVYNDGSVSVEDLVMEIQRSFSDGLLLLRSCESGELSGVTDQSLHVGLADSGDPLPVSNSGKRPAPTKERRGCYKRRRAIDSRVKKSVTIEDGFAWRKYGQKMILNSKSPRCYYRCTHKHEHGCKALKQVQKLEGDESNMYRITYFGHHTCPTPNSFSHSRVVNSSLTNSPSTITNIQVESSIKQEVDSKAQSTDVSDTVSSANDSFPALRWNEVIMDHEVTLLTYFNIENSSASTTPHGFLDMNFLSNNEEFSSDFLVDGQHLIKQMEGFIDRGY